MASKLKHRAERAERDRTQSGKHAIPGRATEIGKIGFGLALICLGAWLLGFGPSS